MAKSLVPTIPIEQVARVVRIVGETSSLLMGDPDEEQTWAHGSALPRLLADGWHVSKIIGDASGGYVVLGKVRS